jgi:nucleotide-binding universal stress UspA family protein
VTDITEPLQILRYKGNSIERCRREAVNWILPRRAECFADTPHNVGRLVAIMSAVAVARSSVGIHQVLIATDFSHQSELVIKYGLEFARFFGARAEIAYVLPVQEYVLAGGDGLEAGRDSARRDLHELRQKLRRNAAYDDNTQIDVSLLEGPAADALLDCARADRADLVIVGTHGRGSFGKVCLGSVAEKVFRHSSVPVITIGPNLKPGHKAMELRHILAPCDLTARSHPAVELAAQLAEDHHSWLTVLHVVERSGEGNRVDPERVKSGIRENLAEIVGCDEERLDICYRVENGRVASTILDVAAELDADLIVLGVRPASGVLDRFHWPIAYEVVRNATCPVLTMRNSGQ